MGDKIIGELMQFKIFCTKDMLGSHSTRCVLNACHQGPPKLILSDKRGVHVLWRGLLTSVSVDCVRDKDLSSVQNRDLSQIV